VKNVVKSFLFTGLSTFRLVVILYTAEPGVSCQSEGSWEASFGKDLSVAG